MLAEGQLFTLFVERPDRLATLESAEVHPIERIITSSAFHGVTRPLPRHLSQC